jgi:polar amino acid transport system substrate-binding protein
MSFLAKTITLLLIAIVLLQHNIIWAQDKYIEMIAGLSKPPFVIANKDRGMQLEIMEAAFAKSNKFVHFTYLPLSRHLDVLHSHEFDGIITLSENEQEWGICLSNPYIVYQNVAVTLEKSVIEINEFDDLVNLKVAAFQNATRFLGEKYNSTFKNAANYIEIADQESQISLLFSGQVDALVMEISIFKHLLANKRSENSTSKIYNEKFVTHFLFSPQAYSAGFKNQQLCQQFDQGINAIMADGSYQQIIDSYFK